MDRESCITSGRYVEGLMARIGNPDALKPPLPPLTRYKRNVALKLQSAPSNGSTRPATLPLDKCAHHTCDFVFFLSCLICPALEPLKSSFTLISCCIRPLW